MNKIASIHIALHLVKQANIGGFLAKLRNAFYRGGTPEIRTAVPALEKITPGGLNADLYLNSSKNIGGWNQWNTQNANHLPGSVNSVVDRLRERLTEGDIAVSNVEKTLLGLQKVTDRFGRGSSNHLAVSNLDSITPQVKSTFEKIWRTALDDFKSAPSAAHETAVWESLIAKLEKALPVNRNPSRTLIPQPDRIIPATRGSLRFGNIGLASAGLAGAGYAVTRGAQNGTSALRYQPPTVADTNTDTPQSALSLPQTLAALGVTGLGAYGLYNWLSAPVSKPIKDKNTAKVPRDASDTTRL